MLLCKQNYEPNFSCPFEVEITLRSDAVNNTTWVVGIFLFPLLGKFCNTVGIADPLRAVPKHGNADPLLEWTRKIRLVVLFTEQHGILTY